MSVNAAFEDKYKARQQEQPAKAIERGVEVRKDMENVHYFQNPSKINNTIHRAPTTCQYQPTT